MLAIFERCSSTSEDKKAPVKPIELGDTCERIYNKILKYVTEQDFYGIKTKKEFFEIYYWYLGYEVSINLLQGSQMSKTILHMMVYGEKKRGRTRRMLKRLLEFYKELLA